MSIPTIIARSDLVVVLPRPVANAFVGEKNVHIISAPLEIPTYDLKMHRHRRFHKDPKIVWLRAAVLKLFANAADNK